MRRTLLPLALVSALLFTAAPAQAADRLPPLDTVTARLETPALFDDEAGGDADVDDPAIWVNPADRSRSRVIVTAKNGGLFVYDLAGHQTQHLATPDAPGPDDESGRFNNVDLVTGFRLGGRTVDLAVVTDRGRDKLRFYRIDDGTLIDVTAPNVPFAFNRTQEEVNEQATAYGLATYRTGSDWYAVASRRHTPELGMFRLVAADGGKVSYRKTDSLVLPARFRLPNGQTWAPCLEPGEGPQVEGMTVDPTLGTLYAAQEDVALWRVQVAAGRFASRPSTVERVREYGVPATYNPQTEECDVDWSADPGFGGRIAADVEGVTIYRTGLLTGTMVVSSQGDDTFYSYDRLTNRPLTRFAVVDGVVDGSQECDGASVVSTPLPGFPGGLLVVHDGHEVPDSDRTATNVKFLDAGFLRRR